MLVIKLIRYTEHGNLVMCLRVSRNPVLDYMEQANIAAKPYIEGGWHLLHAYIE